MMTNSTTCSLALILVAITSVTAFVEPLPQVRSCRGTIIVRQQLPGSTGPYFEDFERLYHDQTAEYGIDLARQFQREQQVRIRRRRQQIQIQQQFEEIQTQPEFPSSATTSPNSPGYFSTPGVSPRIGIVPTTARRRMMQSNNNPWTVPTPKPTTTSSNHNQDNLFLIMSATVAAVAPSTTPVLLSVVAIVFSLSLSISFLLGDESPLVSTTTYATTTSMFPTQSSVTEHSHSTLFSQIHGL